MAEINTTQEDHYEKSSLVVEGYVGNEYIKEKKSAIDLTELYSNNVGNIIKYAIRYKYHKDGELCNLQKALWYINRCIEKEFFEYSYEDPQELKSGEGFLMLCAFRSHFPIVHALVAERGVVSIVGLERAKHLVEKLIQEIRDENKQ